MSVECDGYAKPGYQNQPGNMMIWLSTSATIEEQGKQLIESVCQTGQKGLSDEAFMRQMDSDCKPYFDNMLDSCIRIAVGIHSMRHCKRM